MNDLYIIKYGDLYPVDSSIKWAESHMYEIWPELEEHRNTICIIYAGLGIPQFHKRKLESIVEEMQYEFSQGKRNFIFQCLDEGLALANILHLHDLVPLITDIMPYISLIHATGAYDGEEQYKRICQSYKFPELLKIISGSNFEKNCKKYLEYEIPYTGTKKTRKFLSFNKVDRQHRIGLFNELLKLDLVKDSYYSFDIEQSSLNILRNDIKQRYNSILQIQDSLPLVLNRNATRDNPVDIRNEDLKYFDESYFSVITETLFYDMLNVNRDYLYINAAEIFGIFPSEKIFKCIALGHPFIIASTQGYLQGLRSRGYQTFSPFIDESYDNIADDHIRLEAIVSEVNRLCCLSDRELDQFVNNVKPILEHNRKHYATISDYKITKNILSLLK